MQSVFNKRQERLETAMKREGYDSIVLTPGPLLHYLTGLSLGISERPIVAFFSTSVEPVFVLPTLEKEQLTSLPFRYECFNYGENPSEWQFSFDQAAAYCSIFDRSIGIEPQAMRVFVLNHLRESAWTTKFSDAKAVLEEFRSRKDDDELSKMRKAVKIAEDALRQTIRDTEAGQTEIEIASRLFSNLLTHGSAGPLPFSPIVAGGPNSANPHATPGQRKIQNGDILLVDWGASNENYCSDLTRVFSVGEPEAEMKKVAEVVLKANEAALKRAAPGVAVSAIDIAARSVIEDAGYGEYFTHRTGHGLGLAVHEPPYIRSSADTILEPGMTFTIEPGIYLSGKGGVRIEDDILVTESGAESLSTMERRLTNIGE